MVTVIRSIVDTVTPLSLRFRSKCVAFGTYTKDLQLHLDAVLLLSQCCLLSQVSNKNNNNNNNNNNNSNNNNNNNNNNKTSTFTSDYVI